MKQTDELRNCAAYRSHEFSQCFDQDASQLYAWWSVDLGARQAVTEVKITNRGDCCGKKLHPHSLLFYLLFIRKYWRGVLMKVTWYGSRLEMEFARYPRLSEISR